MVKPCLIPNMVHAGVGWSGTETKVHSNGAECSNLNDVHLWECYIVLIKSVPVIVYCGVREWSLHGLLRKFSSGLGVPGNDSLNNEIFSSISLCNKQGALMTLL